MFAFILLMLVLCYVARVSLAIPMFLIGGEQLYIGGPEVETDIPPPVIWFIFVILVPIIETLIFQFAIIRLLRVKTRLSSGMIIFISALAFGLVHYYSIPYIVLSFATGLIFAYAYLIYLDLKKDAFIVVTVIHGLNNASALALHAIEW